MGLAPTPLRIPKGKPDEGGGMIHNAKTAVPRAAEGRMETTCRKTERGILELVTREQHLAPRLRSAIDGKWLLRDSTQLRAELATCLVMDLDVGAGSGEAT